MKSKTILAKQSTLLSRKPEHACDCVAGAHDRSPFTLLTIIIWRWCVWRANSNVVPGVAGVRVCVIAVRMSWSSKHHQVRKGVCPRWQWIIAGTIIGSIKQANSSCSLNYDIMDSNGETQMQILGPPFNKCYTCCADIDFPVCAQYIPTQFNMFSCFQKMAHTKLGRLQNNGQDWQMNCFRMSIALVSNVGYICNVLKIHIYAFLHPHTFDEWIYYAFSPVPIDLDVNLKATLFGSLFLVDLMAFEQQKSNAGNAYDCVSTCACGILLCPLR